jgi:uncharacterized YigZ family protein
MSDDGEPQGTGGPPILAVLRGADVGDTLVVVTRYFGGTKLGTGGLVRAYTEAAQLGLSQTPFEWKIAKQAIAFEVAYSFYEGVKLLLAGHEGEIQSETFDAQVVVFARLPQTQVSAFQRALTDYTHGRAEVVLL